MRRYLLIAMLLTVCASYAFADDVPVAPADGGVLKDVVREIVEIGNILEQKGVRPDPELLRTSLIRALIESVDPLGALLTVREAEMIREEEDGVFHGIGVRVQMKDGLPVVIGLTEDSPAAGSGLLEGDVIEQIDGRDTAEMTLEETIDQLRGNKGEEVKLSVRGAGETNEPRTVSIVRDVVRMPVTGMMEEWPQLIGYIKVDGLYKDSGERIMTQMGAWEDDEYIGVILDLRDSGGSALGSAAMIAGLFAAPGEKLFSVAGGCGADDIVYTIEDGTPLSMPLMLLVNCDTRGASETLAAVLKGRKGVVLIGSNTTGDDRIREAIPLPDGNVLYVATKTVVPNGRPSYGGSGVLSDIAVVDSGVLSYSKSAENKDSAAVLSGMTENERVARALMERIGADEALSRAADILLGIKALGMQVK